MHKTQETVVANFEPNTTYEDCIFRLEQDLLFDLRMTGCTFKNCTFKGRTVLWYVPIDAKFIDCHFDWLSISVPKYSVSLDKLFDLSIAAQINEISADDLSVRAIPANIKRCMRLSILSLGKNYLSKLPEEFCRLGQLTELDLRCNSLIELPDEFGDLVNLQKLNLNKTQVKSFPASFFTLQSLRELKLECCKLTELDERFNQFKYLETLDLQSSELPVLPNIFSDLRSLHTLNLCCNRLTRIPNGIEHISRVNLDANDLACIESAKWMWQQFLRWVKGNHWRII